MKLYEKHFEWRAAAGLAAGDVYILPRDSGYWVCMASMGANGETMFAVVLGEQDAPSGDPIPRFINLDALNADMVARCIDPRLEPGMNGDDGPGVGMMPVDTAMPGDLVLDGEGHAYLYVRQQNQARYFDISGGATLPHVHSRAAFKDWRMLSLHGDQRPLVLTSHRSPV